MWLLLPFDAVDSDLSIDCFKVAFDYIDISGPQVCDIKICTGTSTSVYNVVFKNFHTNIIHFQMSILRSRELSSDLKLLYPSLSSIHGKWEKYDPLLLKLLSFIPPTLPYSRLTELDPQLGTTQSLPSLLYEELCVHNSSLIQLHASLRELFTFTSGDALFTSQTGLALKSIRDNHIPTTWKSLLPFPLGQCTELVPALNLLKCRMEFYIRTLQNGNGCGLLMEFEPYFFSNPQDVISRTLQTSPSDSQIDAKVNHTHC